MATTTLKTNDNDGSELESRDGRERVGERRRFRNCESNGAAARQSNEQREQTGRQAKAESDQIGEAKACSEPQTAADKAKFRQKQKQRLVSSHREAG